MPDVEFSVVDEVETAINNGTAEKRLETIKRVTDLFLASAESFNSKQIELFGDVLERLIKTIEIRAIADVSVRIALAEMSSQLAPVPQAPPSVVRRLAGNDEITVARPVLTESACLSTEDLVEIARTKGEQHLLAMSGRWWLKEVVTDVILARRYPSVSRRIVNNPGARVSAAGFAIVVAQAEADPELAVETGIRVDLPSGTPPPIAAQRHRSGPRAAIVPRASARVRGNPQRDRAVSAGVNREMSKVREFTAAQRLVARLRDQGELKEATLFEFAKQRKYEETVAALAALSHSTIEVIRPLMQSLRDDGVLVPCRVAGLSWETVHAVLESRLATGSMGPHELANARSQFGKMTAENARRLLSFWQVRSSPSSSSVN